MLQIDMTRAIAYQAAVRAGTDTWDSLAEAFSAEWGVDVSGNALRKRVYRLMKHNERIKHAATLRSVAQRSDIYDASYLVQEDGTVRFGIIGDPHFGSTAFSLKAWEHAVKVIVESGCDAILIPGNYIHGIAKHDAVGHVTTNISMQLDMMLAACKKFNIPIFFIDGYDHEGWSIKRDGVVVGEMLIGRAKDPKYVFLGVFKGDMHFGNPHSFLRVMHPGGGTSKGNTSQAAFNYVLSEFQRGVTNLPRAIVMGHYHKFDICQPAHNVTVLQAGSIEGSGAHAQQNNLYSNQGVAIADVVLDPETRQIIAFGGLWYPAPLE